VTVLCFVVQCINVSSHYSLIDYGILPRHPFYLLGILRFPFIHGSWDHLFSNLGQFALLLAVVGFIHPKKNRLFHSQRLLCVLLGIWLLCGFGVWCVARMSFHIGLSGVNYGLLGYVLIYALLRGDLWVGVSFFCLWWWWPMLTWGLLPSPHLSFESHWCGFLVGVIFGGIFSLYDRVSPKTHNST
jgi:membrane associated rhomboid family serine protease